MKIWNYIWMSISMMLFFEFMGFQTALSGIFNFFSIGIQDGVLTSFSFSASDWVGYIFGGITDALTSAEGLIATIIAGGITAGLIYSGRADIAVKASFAGVVFIGFLPTLYFALTKAIELQISSWALGILALIFIPYTIGFLFALVEYIVGGGTD